MSLMNLQHGMERIRCAEFTSPIAVFKCEQSGMLNFVFANTVVTRKLIAAGGRDYLGSFHGAMPIDRVEGILRTAIDTGKSKATKAKALLD